MTRRFGLPIAPSPKNIVLSFGAVHLVLLVAAVGCGADQPTGVAETAARVGQVVVEPAAVRGIGIGDTRQFEVEAVDGDGNTLSGVAVDWSSSNTAVATVDGDGTATARGEGTARIVATADGVADSASFTVDTGSSGETGGEVVVPAPGDWSAQGTVLTPGSDGAWDSRFPHGTPGPVLEKNGTYYMYYVGAAGDRSSDGGPASRAVGVATASSPSGPWSKHPDNPVISWSELQDNGDEEEGAWRIAGLVDDDGTVLLYVTDLVGSGGSVNGDIRLFTSSDGVDFADRGIVIDHRDDAFPGSDELGALGAWKGDDGTYHIYYVAKGGLSPDWQLALASGPAPDDFTAGQTVSSSDAFGHGTDPVLKSDSELVVFMGDNGGDFYAYTPPRSDPSALGTRQETYTGLSSDQFAVHLDRDTGTWYGFFTTGTRGDADSVQLYTAPARP